MAVTANQALFDTPEQYDIRIGTGVPRSGSAINRGDWLAYSGTSIFATNAAHTAYWKASGAGIALESNPIYDSYGRQIQNTALRYLRQGLFRASASFSGVPALGIGAYPDATGSAVGGVTGVTGVGATWQTGIKLLMSGATGVGGSGIASVVGHRLNGAGGTAELDLLLMPMRPDYY